MATTPFFFLTVPNDIKIYPRRRVRCVCIPTTVSGSILRLAGPFVRHALARFRRVKDATSTRLPDFVRCPVRGANPIPRPQSWRVSAETLRVVPLFSGTGPRLASWYSCIPFSLSFGRCIRRSPTMLKE